MSLQPLGQQWGVRVEIGLGRRLISNLLTIFLPTLLLNIMGHCSVYFPRFYFEAIITVNLTVMLVLTTMYVGVSDTLPKTAYIKMLDIWFIFCMMIPFMEVILQTYIEHLRTIVSTDIEINHHGRTRKVNSNPPLIQVKERNGTVSPISTIGEDHDNIVEHKALTSQQKREMRLKSAIWTTQYALPLVAVLFATAYFVIGLSFIYTL